MLTWWFSLALAGAPAGMDVDDPTRWEQSWSKLHKGPQGCWEIVGHAAWDWDAGRFGSAKGSAAFVGKLEDGTWKDMVIRSLGELVEKRGMIGTQRVYPHDGLHFVPFIGKVSPNLTRADDDTARSLLDELIQDLTGPTGTSSTRWVDATLGVQLTRSMTIGSAPADMLVYFPDGGTLPAQLDLVVDQPFSLPDNRLVRILDAQAHVRGRIAHGQVFPEAETMSFTASFLGFRAYGAQSIRYETVRPCGGNPVADAVPVKTSP